MRISLKHKHTHPAPIPASTRNPAPARATTKKLDWAICPRATLNPSETTERCSPKSPQRKEIKASLTSVLDNQVASFHLQRA